VTPSDTDAALRDRLQRTARLEEPVDIDDVLVAVEQRLVRRRRRRRGAILAAILVLVGGSVVVATQGANEQDPDRVGPVTLDDSSGADEIDATVLWISAEDGPTLANPNTGETIPFGPRSGDEPWCNTCPLVRVAGEALTAQNGRIYAYTSGDAELRDVGRGDEVFPAADGQSVLVALANQLEHRSLEGALIAGPWPIPSGYSLTFPPRATANGVLIEGSANSFTRPISEWVPTTGEVRSIGTYNRLLDTFIEPTNGRTVIARTDCGGSFPCWLLLTDSATGQTTRVDSPLPGNGFYGGGAFSPDGSQLAVFIATAQGISNQGTSSPAARLGIIDTRSGQLRLIEDSDIPVGETYGYASWDPSGGWLFFDGLSGQLRVLPRGGDRARPLDLAGSYSLVALDRVGIGAATGDASSRVVHRDSARGFSVWYPASWRRAGSVLTPTLGAPGEPPWELVSLGTFDLVANEGDRCGHAPIASLEAMGRGDAFVTLQERPSSAQTEPGTQTPPTPPPLPADPRAQPPDRDVEILHCVAGRDDFDLWYFTFSAGARVFHLYVAIGVDATEATIDQTWNIVATLELDQT